jgi:myo-inositol-1(or 4)-monophosphatase
MSIIELAMRAAREAGAILQDFATRGFQVTHKGRINLLTEADLASERHIKQLIAEHFPAHRIIAEESWDGTHDVNDENYCWIIDPLDGTTNFAHQYPFFCVSVGFEQKGEIVCGAVYDPWRDEMFFGARGHGAFLDGQRLRVSDVDQLGAGLLLTGFPYGVRDKIKLAMSQFEAFVVASQAVRRGGAAALDICYTAMGRCDGFWELDLQPWDTAAGLVILEEAGGQVTDFKGEPYSVYKKQILASNGKIHGEMVRVLDATVK